MTRFWREGHERFRNGQWEYVSGHWVDRDDWDRSSWGAYDPEWSAFMSGRSWPRRYLDENEANATCPVCGEPVWFFRNIDGGCAYFNEIGKPWPKHPCMDSNLLGDRTAHWQARVEYRLAYDEEEDELGVCDAQKAYSEWALALLRAHTLNLDVRSADARVKRAVAATRLDAKRPQTKRDRQDRLRLLRERLRELKSDLRDAREAVNDAQQNYESELEWLEEYGT